MTTYLTHPDHGVHLAYSPEEIASCIKNGWKVHGDAPPSLHRVIPDEPEEAPKRGRPRKVV